MTCSLPFVDSDQEIKLDLDGTIHPCGLTRDEATSVDVDGSGGDDIFQID